MSHTQSQPVIQVTNVCKTFPNGRKALDGVSIQLAAGEMVALIGASGSGKSTLIRHIGGLIVANKGNDGGEIAVFGDQVQAGGRLTGDVSQVRRRLGVIFQQFNLVPRLTVLTNVLAGRLGRMPKWRGVLMQFSHLEKQRAMQALARVGIAATARQRAATLSGGQQQRAAIARALCMEPEALLFDEPTSALDPELEQEVVKVIKALAEEGRTMLIVTHDMKMASDVSDHVIFLHRGLIEEQGPPETLFGAPKSERLQGFLQSTVHA